VRTASGAEIEADLVVDAMGRRSKLSQWVAGAGGRPCLALPAQVLQRPGLRDKLTALAASPAPSLPPGPTREQLIALTHR
jgi:hypothetical protein